MIVRCTTCNSAFAVDDAKVEDKKFAFSCPKCNNENIIDNRKQARSAAAGPSMIDEKYKEQTGLAVMDETASGADHDDIFLDEKPSRNTESVAKRDILIEDEPVIDDSDLIDSEDLSGLAEPERFEQTSVESADLPPADDMRADVPLDDVMIDDELKDLGITDIEIEDDTQHRKKDADQDSNKSVFDELELETVDIKADSDIIRDEMETKDEIHLDEIDDIDALLAEDEKKKEIVDEFEPLEIENDDVSSKPLAPNLILDEEVKTEEVFRAKEPEEDESITIDLDTLDVDLEEPENMGTDAKTGPGKVATSPHEEEDENITIDLDTLDIDLQDDSSVSKGESHEDLDLDLSDFSDETIQELEEVSKTSKGKQDDDITLDLNTLDISLEESDEIKTGEDLDEDEKLTLEDAGLTLEELTTDELTSVSSEAGSKSEDEDIRLSVDELGTDFDMNEIERELREAETILAEPSAKERDHLVVDELSDLPEIDFDKDLVHAGVIVGAGRSTGLKKEDELFTLDDRGKGISVGGGLKKELPDMVPRGAVNFSIDYSIKYSRIGAILRLFGLFFLGLLPHYVVFLVYNVLSIILSIINHIIVIFTEKSIEDFSEIHGNTLRYLLSISASSIGIVEDMPIFAGRDNIDYPLQLRIIYPLRSSRLLAFMRLSVIGIMLLTLPHLIILAVMSLVIPLVFLAGILSVLITGGWPHLLFDFMTRYYRYIARVLAFSIGIIDVYPKFKFD